MHEEIRELEDYGITRIYSPEDGQKLGLPGIIQDMLERAAAVRIPPLPDDWPEKLRQRHSFTVTQLVSLAEDNHQAAAFAGIRADSPRPSKNRR